MIFRSEAIGLKVIHRIKYRRSPNSCMKRLRTQEIKVKILSTRNSRAQSAQSSFIPELWDKRTLVTPFSGATDLPKNGNAGNPQISNPTIS